MIKKDSRFFEDLAKAATGAVGALAGLRGQIHKEIRTQINRFIAEMDFVPREDFEIVEAMAREARLHNQKLEARIAKLEGKKPTAPTKKKTAPVKRKKK